MAIVNPQYRALYKAVNKVWGDCAELQRCMILQDDLMGVRYKERDPRIDVIVAQQFSLYMGLVSSIASAIKELPDTI